MDFFFCFFSVCCVNCDKNEIKLVRKLMADYDKRIRPSLNASESLNVTFGLALAQIIDVDEKNQILTTNCWLNQIWIDYALRWDPDDYGGIKVIRLPFDQVWRPDVLLYNNADVSSIFSSISSNVIVTSDGNVTWLSMVIFKSSCSIDVRYFPFDEQNCTMLFASWTYDGYQLNLMVNTGDGDTTNYIHNSEWELDKLKVERNVVYYSCCAEPYPDITFYIHIRRRPLFYIFNMILPCIMITLVALLGFYIPSDSGEKVTMGITTLLSMTVFMMLVTENMPPTSDVLPLIGLYYGMTIFIVSFATAMTVFTLNIHHKGARGLEVPRIIKKICFGFFAKIFCMKIESDVKTKNSNVIMLPFKSNCTYCKIKLFVYYPRTILSRSNKQRMRLINRDLVITSVINSTVFGFSPNSRNVMELPTPGTSDIKWHHNMMSKLLVEEIGLSTSNGNNVPFRIFSHFYYVSLQEYMPATELSSFSHVDVKLETEPKQANGGISGHNFSPRFRPMTSTSSPVIENFELQFMRVLQKVYQTIERNEMRLVENDRRESIKLDWQQVAQIVDRVLLSCFVIMTMVITGIVLLSAPRSEMTNPM
ncbi:hypothetical protein LOTGIDRAFT_136425 [Lottia gigantea]|uniref:Uncharacterized protein n=1 Tax=Lottia gigantea TaxID=225164 RepID=V4BEP8_LOTGI|nr:hypothetical protein LOTGIDRAFT_136425 [Lottia gigantea]ESP04297.1 hypothetical protein LOTGIDRAFT_136425 [Lottia gigantea]